MVRLKGVGSLRGFVPREVKIFTPWPSGTMVYGSSGMGKSYLLHWLLEFFYARGSKIVDVYDEGRFENCYAYFPNSNFIPSDMFPHIEPRGYPLECFVPMSESLPSKLPSLFKPFRITFSDLKKEEFIVLLGSLSRPQRDLISVAWRKRKKGMCFVDFFKLIHGLIADSRVKIGKQVLEICDNRSGLALLLKLDRLHQSGLMCDTSDPLALDFDKIMRDNKTITSFSFAFLEDRNLRHLLWAFILRMIHSMRKARQYSAYPELCLVHRELQKNAPARGKGLSTVYDGQKLALESIRAIIEEPRDPGIRVIADSQAPMKIDSEIRKGFATHFIFQMDRLVVEQLPFWLDPKTTVGVQLLGVGVCAIKTRPERGNPLNRFGIQFPAYIPPTRSRCKEHDDLFFKIWKDAGLHFNTWKRPKIEKIIHIRRIEKKEKGEVVNLRKLSIYEYYHKTIELILKDNPGYSVPDIHRDPLITGYGWSKDRVARVVENMLKEVPPLLIRKKKGQKIKLFLPHQVDSPGKTKTTNLMDISD